MGTRFAHPGRKAAEGLAEHLRGEGLPVHVARILDGEDPASLARTT